jgi:hypothetical protein
MKIAILGAGIVGRLAKKIFPEATLFEEKKQTDTFTSELGVHVSIVPISELASKQYKRIITIDGQKPTLEAIAKYKKKIAREDGISYGDCRQFEPEQVVYVQEFPRDTDVKFCHQAVKITLESKEIVLGNNVLPGKTLMVEVKYDVVISTIPLPILLRITNMLSQFQDHTSSFFMHRPIYITREQDTLEPNVIRENYITDLDSPFYRASYCNGVYTRESLFKVEGAMKIFPGKIYNNTNTQNILDDLKHFGVHCIGRYAQWDNRIHIWNAYMELKKLREVV